MFLEAKDLPRWSKIPTWKGPRKVILLDDPPTAYRKPLPTKTKASKGKIVERIETIPDFGNAAPIDVVRKVYIPPKTKHQKLKKAIAASRRTMDPSLLKKRDFLKHVTM